MLDSRIGVVPSPIYAVMLLVIGLFIASGKVPSDLTMSIVMLSVGGFFFMELGRRIPPLGLMGGAAIMAFVVPSAMVRYGWIPAPAVTSINTFVKTSNFLYLYIAVIVVGSVLSMDRRVLVAGFLKIFVPLAVGSVAAAVVGTLVGMAMGMSAERAFFFVVAPIMSGGLGEGAIPLAIGYALRLHEAQDQLFGQIIPVVMLGSFTAVLFSGALNLVGKRFKHLTGDGQLQPGIKDAARDATLAAKPSSRLPELPDLAAAVLVMVTLYLIGVLVQHTTDFPAPIVMLLFVVAAKLLQLVSPQLEDASRAAYQFFAKIVTWPLLFAMGVSLTPWDAFASAFTVPIVVTVVATVATLMGTGFVVGRLIGMYPIDVAIVNGCHSGQGGTGDIAILSAANRMQLMPFAQIATRIGGAATVTLALLVFRHFF